MLVLSLFLSWIALDPSAEWAVRDTEIYQPLQTGEVIVSPTGDALVLNFSQAVITRFNAEGEKANTIGFKGRGPGGLTYPMNFYLEDDIVYVHDIIDATINSFHIDGRFIEKIRCPKRNMDLAKVPGGWIYGRWQASRGTQADPAITWVDNAMTKSRQIFDIKTLGERGGLSIEASDGETKAVFSPISTAPIMAFSSDHSRIYIAEAKGFKIYVIDGRKSEIVNTISREDRAVPFDREWGDERLTRVKEMMAARGHKAKVEKNYPETFPNIRSMKVLPDGTLVVDRWRGNPEESHWTIAFDPDGKERALDWPWDAVERVVGSVEDWLIFTTLNEEEAGLGRCKAADIKTFLKDNPIDFDGTVGRQIMMED